MKESTFKAIKFVPKDDKDFGITVRKRVNEYFKSNNISRLGDYRIWIKIIVMPLFLLVPFAIIMSNWFSDNLLVFFSLWVVMGIALAGAGMGIMHDACHGSISKNKTVNTFLGELVLSLAGGSTFTWKIQHNFLHHTYTNIDGYDEDIDPKGLMRFSPHQPVKSFYKFQVIYAWFLYGLMTFFWATFKDFSQLSRYDKKGLVKSHGSTYNKEFTKLVFQKIIYHTVFIVLPILYLNVAWWNVLAGWFLMHFVAGLILGIVFQAAHVVPTSEFPLPDSHNAIEGDWAKHQLLTTANFAANNRLLSWYVGGLNYQIEHHLFPHMSHVHYREVSKIVRATAEEFNLPYHSQTTFIGAVTDHAKMLYKMGS